MPGLPEVSGWVGFEVDEAAGARVGRLLSVYVDAVDASPAWLVVALGRRGAKKIAVPLHDCAAGGGRVWSAHERAALRDAPAVDPTRPLLREHELAICAHFGIGEDAGRALAVVAREHGVVTARPAA